MTVFAQYDLTAATNNAVFTSADVNGDLVTVMLTNRNNTTVTVTVSWVPSGGTLGLKSQIASALPIDANMIWERTGLTMGNGDTLYVNPSAAGVSLTVQGLPI